MNKYVKLILVVVATMGYLLVLRYIAPSREPYYILSIALIGYVAWLYGMATGLIAAMLLVPATYHIYNQFNVSTSYMAVASSPPYIALKILTAGAMGLLHNRIAILSKKETVQAEVNENLQKTLSEVREFGGIHSLCTSCKNIMNDDGTWEPIDTYLKEKTKAEFSHGICPECVRKYKTADGEPAE
ncbi:MAG: hypothetical protein ABFR47_09665 [Verrucomicrobiota bacterium]